MLLCVWMSWSVAVSGVKVLGYGVAGLVNWFGVVYVMSILVGRKYVVEQSEAYVGTGCSRMTGSTRVGIGHLAVGDVRRLQR